MPVTTQPISVLTIVRDREAHLVQLVEGLRHSARPPAELIVVDMSTTPVLRPNAPFPVRIDRFPTDGLPLAAARNRAARLARSPHLVFLDIDCIALSACLGLLGDALETHDALVCADIRYLGEGDAAPGWTEAALRAAGRPHPVRRFPKTGLRREDDPGLFWSLAFAIRAERFAALGGFDEAFTGYGGEDTDFGYRADRAGVPLLFAGGAIACHQHHESHDPPLRHCADIVRNAGVFHDRWGWWPMAGWLDAFEALGMIHRDADGRPVLCADRELG